MAVLAHHCLGGFIPNSRTQPKGPGRTIEENPRATRWHMPTRPRSALPVTVRRKQPGCRRPEPRAESPAEEQEAWEAVPLFTQDRTPSSLASAREGHNPASSPEDLRLVWSTVIVSLCPIPHRCMRYLFPNQTKSKKKTNKNETSCAVKSPSRFGTVLLSAVCRPPRRRGGSDTAGLKTHTSGPRPSCEPPSLCAQD